jgi:hydroxypyruvate isomerase
MNRRQAIQNGLLSLAAVQTATMSNAMVACQPKTNTAQNMTTQAPFRHSVCKWCYSKMPLEAMAEQVKSMGITSIELLGVDEWPILKKYGLTCAMGNAPFISLTDGLNKPANHAKLQSMYPDLLRKAADAGIPNIICFSGNRNGLSDEQGIENCAKGLEPIVKEAEKAGVNVVMELLNSKVDHKDYQCDHTEWGVKLAEKIGSPRFKLLYDIYHMQIMEGDVIATIRKHQKYIAHYHTAGVPGRHEIDENQELNYHAIMKAIASTGYTGFVAQEFIPVVQDQLDTLRKAVQICDVKA